MSAEENKAVARRWFEEIFNERKLEVADEIVTADSPLHDPNLADLPAGPEGSKQTVTVYTGAFSDARIDIEDQLAEGDMVVTRWVGRGINDGEFMGSPASGNRVEVPGITIHRVSDGVISETWTSYDAMGMMQQIGLIPAPEETTEA